MSQKALSGNITLDAKNPSQIAQKMIGGSAARFAGLRRDRVSDLVDERNHIVKNGETVKDMKFPPSVPVLFLLSGDSVEVLKSMGKD